MRSVLLLTPFLFSATIGFCQNPAIAADSIVLKLTITNLTGKPIKGKVNFENKATHKVTSCVTDKNGNANHTLETGKIYSITIPISTDQYEYTIPDFTISPLPLTFKFTVESNGQANKLLLPQYLENVGSIIAENSSANGD